MAAPTASSSPVGICPNGYRFIDKLATGGMAEVYLARAEDGRGPFAIKKMLPEYANQQEYREMFEHEALIGSRLDHENICRVYEHIDNERDVFIVMEYLEGATLAGLLQQLVTSKRVLPIGVALQIVVQAARGLEAVHRLKDSSGAAAGVIHRDITPGNLLLTTEGVLKLLDFGIAKTGFGKCVTRAGTLKGKFSYMAPEQLSNGNVDQRADIFALGVVLFELLAVKRLFKRTTEFNTMRAVCADPILGIEDFRDVSPGLAAVVNKALARDPNERFASALEFAEALEALDEDWHPVPNEALGKFISTLFGHQIRSRRNTWSESKAEQTELPRRTETPTKVVSDPAMSILLERIRLVEQRYEEVTRAVAPLMPLLRRCRTTAPRTCRRRSRATEVDLPREIFGGATAAEPPKVASAGAWVASLMECEVHEDVESPQMPKGPWDAFTHMPAPI